MKRRKNPQIPEEQDYDYESLREDRKYGLYWFSGLWKILRPVLIGLCALLIVFGVLSTVWSHVQDKYLSPVDPADDTEIAFSVETGNSLSRVSRNLESAGLIKNSSVFKYYCDFAGMGQKIQAGDYKVKKSMDLFQIAQLLTTGDGRPTVTDITIIPGYTIENIANYLKEKGILQDTAEFLNLCKTGEGVTDYYFLQDELKTQNVNSRKYLLEGYLAPNTYEVYLNATPKDIVKKLLDQTDYVFSNVWQERAAELGMTMDQTLPLAVSSGGGKAPGRVPARLRGRAGNLSLLGLRSLYAAPSAGAAGRGRYQSEDRGPDEDGLLCGLRGVGVPSRAGSAGKGGRGSLPPGRPRPDAGAGQGQPPAEQHGLLLWRA